MADWLILFVIFVVIIVVGLVMWGTHKLKNKYY